MVFMRVPSDGAWGESDKINGFKDLNSMVLEKGMKDLHAVSEFLTPFWSSFLLIFLLNFPFFLTGSNNLMQA